MKTLKDLMARASRLIEEHRAEATATNAVYKFVLDGDGGGTFVLNLTDTPGVTEGDGPADCIMRLSVADFLDMAEDRIDSRELFFQGRLVVDGDMEVALRLKKLRQNIGTTEL